MGGPDEQQLAILTTFVMRARRVAEHSLAKDHELLRDLAERRIKLRFEPGATFIIERRPAEEQLESAAARVRPLILQRESTYWSKVLSALGYFARHDNDAMSTIAEFRRAWRATSEKDGTAATYVQMRDAQGNETRLISDLELAYAYIYGDVIHHDEDRIAGVVGFDIQERFHEAAPLIGRMVALTISTLNFTRHLVDSGVIPLPAGIFSVDVVAKETDTRRPARAYFAEEGTEPPAKMDEEFSQEWTEVNPVTSNRSAFTPAEGDA